MGRPGLSRHPKFTHLSRLLQSRVLARGILELLWEVAYEIGDDRLGKAENIEYSVEWKGEPGALVCALVDAGFLDRDGELYRIHDLLDHAPEYVRRRLKREQQRKEAASRLKSLTGQCPVSDQPLTTTRTPAPGFKIKIKNTVAPDGAPVSVSPQKRKSKPPKTEFAEHAEKIVAYYEAEVRGHRVSRYRAREHIVAILRSGVPWEWLWECVNQYAAEAEKVEMQFRKVAGNFFGRDAVYKAYLEAAKAEVTQYDAEKARRGAGSSAAGAGQADPEANAR